MRGGTEYSFVGAEDILFSESTIDAMAQKKIKPGDIIYSIAECEEEEIIWFDALPVQDIATKEIKLCDDWFVIEESTIFDNEKDAEEYVIKLSEKLGYRIVKGGLFGQEAADGE